MPTESGRAHDVATRGPLGASIRAASPIGPSDVHGRKPSLPRPSIRPTSAAPIHNPGGRSRQRDQAPTSAVDPTPRGFRAGSQRAEPPWPTGRPGSSIPSSIPRFGRAARPPQRRRSPKAAEARLPARPMRTSALALLPSEQTGSGQIQPPRLSPFRTHSSHFCTHIHRKYPLCPSLYPPVPNFTHSDGGERSPERPRSASTAEHRSDALGDRQRPAPRHRSR
jgi:hypothetical protein